MKKLRNTPGSQTGAKEAFPKTKSGADILPRQKLKRLEQYVTGLKPERQDMGEYVRQLLSKRDSEKMVANLDAEQLIADAERLAKSFPQGIGNIDEAKLMVIGLALFGLGPGNSEQHVSAFMYGFKKYGLTKAKCYFSDCLKATHQIVSKRGKDKPAIALLNLEHRFELERRQEMSMF